MTDRQYALGMTPPPRRQHFGPPLVAPEPVWLAPGQGWPCFLLAVVIAVEVAVLVWQVGWRHA